MAKQKILIVEDEAIIAVDMQLKLELGGYDVIGFTMLLSDEQTISMDHNERRCCGIQIADDAKRVASIIDIPHYVINLKNEFRQHVLQPFIQSYLSGKTPSPCILCNYWVLF